MSSVFSDPNNHVPTVSPDDTWDDGDAALDKGVLPPRRTWVAEEENTAEAIVESGLRIEARFSDESGKKRKAEENLQVREYGGEEVVRLEEEPPHPEKIAAFSKLAMETAPSPAFREKSGGEGREWGHAEAGTSRWIAASGAGIVVLMIGAFAVWSYLAGKRSGPASTGIVPVEEVSPVGLEELESMLAAHSEASRVFEAYMKALKVDEILPLLRKPDEVKALVEENWQPLSVAADWKVPEGADWIVAQPVEGEYQGTLVGIAPDFSAFRAMFVRENGKLLLDWKATTGYGTASFSELENGGGTPSEIRGHLSQAEYYTADFPEADFISKRLTSPDGMDSLWVYVKRGSRAEELLAGLFQSEGILAKHTGDVQATLELVKPEGNSRPNQWIIGEKLHIGWLTP